MPIGRKYYFGSYGIVRGYGPLHRTIEEADHSVREDGKKQRQNGGSTDRNAVLVSALTGLCWWVDESESRDTPEEKYLSPVRTANGEQAKYSMDILRRYETLWVDPTMLAGFG